MSRLNVTTLSNLLKEYDIVAPLELRLAIVKLGQGTKTKTSKKKVVKYLETYTATTNKATIGTQAIVNAKQLFNRVQAFNIKQVNPETKKTYTIAQATALTNKQINDLTKGTTKSIKGFKKDYTLEKPKTKKVVTK